MLHPDDLDLDVYEREDAHRALDLEAARALALGLPARPGTRR